MSGNGDFLPVDNPVLVQSQGETILESPGYIDAHSVSSSVSPPLLFGPASIETKRR